MYHHAVISCPSNHSHSGESQEVGLEAAKRESNFKHNNHEYVSLEPGFMVFTESHLSAQ